MDSREPALPGDPAAIIESIRVRPADAGQDTEVGSLSAQVTAQQPTLDLCYAGFDSEAHRVARRLYSVSATEGSQTARNDVVVYDGVAAAAAAMAQARQAVAACTPGVRRQSTVGDLPEASFRYAPLAAGGLAADALAVSETASYADGGTQRLTRVVQRRGRILVVLDGLDTPAAALALARVCAQRLAAVPAAQAGG